MRMCHLRANQMSVGGIYLSLESFTKQNQAPEPKMETGKPNQTPRIYFSKISALKTTGVAQMGYT